jgi:DNA-binding transcriptional ArsR family regulator
VPIAEPRQLDQAFHALADSNRRAIVAPLDVSLPTVLQHLDVLQRSGLVRSEKVGRVRTCRLEPDPMRAVEQWIAEHRAIWERRLDLLGDVLDDAFPTTKGHRSK